ncbi:MAG TPA: GTPase Era [Azospirillaceae bacterium]|nr:GTPase Era [Azospirillaceae bacterium]
MTDQDDQKPARDIVSEFLEKSADAAEPAPDNPRCGFVALVGAPNAGKSTLLNALVGAKVSIVSPKVQTTRTKVLGIGMHGDAQLLFVDTPGIFRPKKRLERAMVAAAWGGADDADLVALLVDASRRDVDPDTLDIVARLKDAKRQAVLILNKIDLIPRENLLLLAERLNAEGAFTDIFMVSALTGDGVKDLLDAFAARVPEGPWLYPGDQLSDMPERLLAAEVTREKLFLQLHQELPYATTVETESWEEFQDGSVKISQTIYVQRDNQKAIVLGKGGSKVKAIGAASRKELEEMLDRRVHLMLFVKVRENWTDDPERYRQWGLDYNA